MNAGVFLTSCGTHAEVEMRKIGSAYNGQCLIAMTIKKPLPHDPVWYSLQPMEIAG